MLLDLTFRWSINKDASFLIGNMQSDLDAAAGAGLKAYLYEGGNLADFVAARLAPPPA